MEDDDSGLEGLEDKNKAIKEYIDQLSLHSKIIKQIYDVSNVIGHTTVKPDDMIKLMKYRSNLITHLQ